MYWNVIDENRKNILKKVTDNISLNKYYMAGGTALALQNGARESFDFDFFVQEKFDTKILSNELEKLGNLKISYISNDTLHCILDDVQLTFMCFPNLLIKELVKIAECKNLYLASVIDIATMKLVAISQRGTKKDFFDLYNVCQKYNYSLKTFFSLLEVKYSKEKLNYFHILKSIVYFEDADDEILPKTYIDYNWEDIKSFYKTQFEIVSKLKYWEKNT